MVRADRGVLPSLEERVDVGGQMRIRDWGAKEVRDAEDMACVCVRC